MAGEVNTEVVVGPRSGLVRDELADAPDWSAYAAELRSVLETVVEKSAVDLLEVGELLVNQPLPDRYSGLRNGVRVPPAEALDLVRRMVAGDGPYCRLSAPGRLHIQSGWDGAVHLWVTPETGAALAGYLGAEVSLEFRSTFPESADVPDPVEAVADEGFWDAVRKVSDGTTLLCERWAHGSYGSRWFRVTRENAAEVARLVSPRSLLCVVAEPDLRATTEVPDDAEVLDDGFTAFVSPLLPGALAHREYPGGADSLSDVVGAGFDLLLTDGAMGRWCAVVPDPDGVNRAQWESP
ncbi:hypothetical protein EDD90_8392 [Streptomyces sp. Ag109_O5-1]|uniref:hypothetical protein n=1 Tax=Streptomyces sp. Ag109_O5-1 TaxID=1938851 RepID=UPI000F4DE666|nr:hypothetical protein [Streptomyces sp. Ag109_O5-1]RPE45131.1 hypothetical protein EDD90_8392 [Streptomyces sp. Ag109_O5-1]